MRRVVTGEELAQLYNPDPFAMPRWRAPVYRTPFGIILVAKLVKLLGLDGPDDRPASAGRQRPGAGRGDVGQARLGHPRRPGPGRRRHADRLAVVLAGLVLPVGRPPGPGHVAGLVLPAPLGRGNDDRRGGALVTAFEDRLRWRFLVFLERLLKSRRMHNWIARYLREEVHTNPELEAHVPWMLAEMRRTDTRAVVEAGRALRDFDARPFASTIDVPAAMVITTDDHVVRPVKQRALADAVRARVFEIRADHDATMAVSRPFASLTAEAVEAVCREAAEDSSARRLA